MTRRPRALRAGLALLAAVVGLTGLVAVAQAAGGKAGFTLTAAPSSLGVQQGKTGTFVLTTVSTNGFTGTVALSVTGLPAGTTGSPSPTTLSMRSGSTQTSTLALTVGRTTPVGTYPITVTGRSGTLTHTASASLVVQQTPGALGFTTSPTSATVAPGQAAVHTLSFTRTGSASGAAVTLSAAGLPSGTTAAFSPQPATGTTATLTVQTASGTPTGSYPITITGTTSSGSTATGSVTLVVAQRSGRPFTIASATVATLSPGVFAPLDLLLSNPDNQPLSVTNITVAVSSSAATGCTSADFGAVQYRGRYPFLLPAGADRVRLSAVSGTGAALLPQVGMVNLNRNQDLCKQASVVLTFSGSAQGD